MRGLHPVVFPYDRYGVPGLRRARASSRTPTGCATTRPTEPRCGGSSPASPPARTGPRPIPSAAVAVMRAPLRRRLPKRPRAERPGHPRACSAPGRRPRPPGPGSATGCSSRACSTRGPTRRRSSPDPRLRCSHGFAQRAAPDRGADARRPQLPPHRRARSWSTAEEGALGVVLNRPTELPVGEAVPDLAELADGDPVFAGGPVQPQAVIALAEHTGPVGEESVCGPIAPIQVSDDIEDIERPRRPRPGVRRATRDGARASSTTSSRRRPGSPSRRCPATSSRGDPDGLWRRVLERKGGEFRLRGADAATTRRMN